MITRRLVTPSVIGLAIGLSGLLLLKGAMIYTGELAEAFTREPQDYLDGKWYVGSMSNLGGIVWFGCAAILAFASTLTSENRVLLFWAAILTFAMGFDDIFMLHDDIYPRLGIGDKEIAFIYALAAGATVILGIRKLPHGSSLALMGAIGFWGLSVVLDRYFNEGDQFAEDGAKFVGICFWLCGWATAAWACVRGDNAATGLSGYGDRPV